jgi:hypothetical protein
MQVYPTVLRSVGVGSCSGLARAGAMLTPYIAQETRFRTLHQRLYSKRKVGYGTICWN